MSLPILKELIRRESLSPQDAGCQDYMIGFLERLGFVCQRFDNPPVTNFFARLGTTAPLLVFAGHTDVVPAGDLSLWHANPFELTEKDGLLYGRGVADMKGSLSAMLAMAERFQAEHPNFSGSLGFLITSAEEGDYFDQGTPYLMSELYHQGLVMDYCVVGEPSSTSEVGDVVKVGRRGSLSMKVKLLGKQGHVAYPHLAENPIHQIAPVIAELCKHVWDHGNEFFSPTSFQITAIHADGEASNVIPGELVLEGNFRFSTAVTPQDLQKKVEAFFAHHNLHPNINWRLNGEPFLTSKGLLLDSTIEAILAVRGEKPSLSTTGGTSDGRFIAPYGVEVVELGPVNASIHQVNEWLDPLALEELTEMYYRICLRVFTSPGP